MGDIDLEPVLRRVIQGEEAAARALIEELYPQVIRIVRGHLPRRQAEEDLAQEVFIKLLANLAQYEARAGVPFEHWVSRLATRVCLDALRSERRRPELRLADLSEAEAAWIDYFNATEASPPATAPEEARETVEKLLAQLAAPGPAYPGPAGPGTTVGEGNQRAHRDERLAGESAGFPRPPQAARPGDGAALAPAGLGDEGWDERNKT